MGIDFLNGGAVHVERCVIQGFQTGIFASRSCCAPVFADLYVEDTIVRNCSFDGIGVTSISGLIRATVERSHLVGNGFGLACDSNSQSAVWNAVAAENSTGMSLFARDGHSSSMVIERCLQTDNAVSGVQVQGDIFGSPATLWLSNSTATGNGGLASILWAGIRNLGTSLFLSRTNNTVEGNVHDTFGSIGSYSPR